MNVFVIVQILGIITLILFVISLQQQKKEVFLLIQVVGTIFYIFQYILTNRLTGAVTFVIIVIRGLVFYYYKKKDLKPSLVVLILFQVTLLVSTYFSWQNILSILPYAATAAKTWATWQDDMKWVRRVSFFGQILLVFYNFTAAMYTGALTEVCNVASTLVAIIRFDITGNKLSKK